ncbi:hypothetical protein JDM601_3747 [Mycolicibacter sinensis]|uniref:Uncharacterized protein n=1 Tax=Mycolicibacter sinensis (strain JDM601) TaxID=875328 RepID=F5Z365_MYCSD|nr:hypothetical protein JDM601_3747 [Mycolicibacter sinensis]
MATTVECHHAADERRLHAFWGAMNHCCRCHHPDVAEVDALAEFGSAAA